MGNVQQINNQEVGRDVRDKLNEVREKANQVDDKINLVPTAEQGNVAIFGANGQILDSGLRPGGGAGVNVPSWETVRNIPLAINFVVQFNGRLFSNKVDQNQNNQPPLEGEDTFWRETSEAQSTSTPLYAAGIFREARSEVYVLNAVTDQLEKYVLTVTDLPFISTDFNVELTAGRWQSASGANLSVTRDLNVVNVISEVGTNAILPSATTLLAGVMSAADKTRLDNAAILNVANIFQDDITVNGNLNVVGDITFQNQQELNVTDNLIDVNSGETGAGVTGGFAGMVVDRGSLPNFGILFRESDDLFRIGCFDTFRSDAVSGTTNTIVLPSSASSQDDIYNNVRIRITKSGEFPQFRTITDYVGSARTATVDQAWSIIPDNTWAVRILIEDDTQAVMTRVDSPDDGLPFFWDAASKRAMTRALTHEDVSDFNTEVNALIAAGIGNISSLSFANEVKVAAISSGARVTGELTVSSRNTNSVTIRSSMDGNNGLGVAFVHQRPGGSSFYTPASMTFAPSNRTAGSEVGSFDISILGEGDEKDFRFNSDGSLSIEGQYSTSNASPLGSRPNNSIAALGTVLTADGSGGSSWQSVGNFVTTDTEQDITGSKTFTNLIFNAGDTDNFVGNYLQLDDGVFTGQGSSRLGIRDGFATFGLFNMGQIVAGMQIDATVLNRVTFSGSDFLFNNDDISFGDGTITNNKRLIVNNGNANQPELRYNETTNTWEFSNNGTDFDSFSGITNINTAGTLDNVAYLDQANAFTQPQRITATGDGASLLRLNIERAWQFEQRGTGADSSLVLRTINDNKNFILSSSGRNSNIQFRLSETLDQTNISVNNNIVYHAGNANKDDVDWAADVLQANSITIGDGISATEKELLFQRGAIGDSATDRRFLSSGADFLLQNRETSIGVDWETALRSVNSTNRWLELYYNGSKKIETTNDGVSVTGGISTTGGNSTQWNEAYARISEVSRQSDVGVHQDYQPIAISGTTAPNQPTTTSSRHIIYDDGSGTWFKLRAGFSDDSAELGGIVAGNYFHSGNANRSDVDWAANNGRFEGNLRVGTGTIAPDEKLTIVGGNIEINNTDSALVLNQVLGKYQFRSADVSGVGNTGVACSMAAVSSNSTGSNIDLVFGIRGGLVGNDVERLRVNTGGIAVTGTVIASNVFNNATQTLTGTTPTHDCLTSVNSQITLSGNTTVTFTNLTNGMSGNMRVTQDGTGSRTLTFSPTPEVINGGGGVITLTGNASSTDIISWWYDGTNLNVTYGLNYS